jgi:hypothetical protein
MVSSLLAGAMKQNKLRAHRVQMGVILALAQEIRASNAQAGNF